MALVKWRVEEVIVDLSFLDEVNDILRRTRLWKIPFLFRVNTRELSGNSLGLDAFQKIAGRENATAPTRVLRGEGRINGTKNGSKNFSINRF